MRRLFTIFVFFLFLPTQICEAVNWPLKLCGFGISAYLCDQDDVPFLVVGDNAWSLVVELSTEEATEYLNDRYEKGFTAITMSAIERVFSTNAPNNYYDEEPFTTGVNNWSTRNENYWTHLDEILTLAKNRNIVVFLNPAYIGYQCSGSEGWAPNMLNQTTGAMTEYGEFLGNRYKDYGNIIWVNGGDQNASDCSPSLSTRVTALANGIKTYDTNQLHTAQYPILKPYRI